MVGLPGDLTVSMYNQVSDRALRVKGSCLGLGRSIFHFKYCIVHVSKAELSIKPNFQGQLQYDLQIKIMNTIIKVIQNK